MAFGLLWGLPIAVISINVQLPAWAIGIGGSADVQIDGLLLFSTIWAKFVATIDSNWRNYHSYRLAKSLTRRIRREDRLTCWEWQFGSSFLPNDFRWDFCVQTLVFRSFSCCIGVQSQTTNDFHAAQSTYSDLLSCLPALALRLSHFRLDLKPAASAVTAIIIIVAFNLDQFSKID